MKRDAIHKFITDQIHHPTANQNIEQSWNGYWLATGGAPHGDKGRQFCGEAKKIGWGINNEYGFDVIGYHFPGIKRHAGDNWDPWGPKS